MVWIWLIERTNKKVFFSPFSIFHFQLSMPSPYFSYKIYFYSQILYLSLNQKPWSWLSQINCQLEGVSYAWTWRDHKYSLFSRKYLHIDTVNRGFRNFVAKTIFKKKNHKSFLNAVSVLHVNHCTWFLTD